MKEEKLVPKTSNSSPLPKTSGPEKVSGPVLEIPADDIFPVVDFFEAMKGMFLNGKKYTNLEWEDDQFYVLVVDDFLRIHKPDGQNYDWVLNRKDAIATKWVEIK